MTQRGPALVRIALFCLFFGAFAMGLVQPAQAGTAEAPEIQDPANDQSVAGEVPVSQQPPAGTTVGLSVDLTAGWIEETDAATMTFTVKVQGTGGPSTTSEQDWLFHVTIGTTEYIASARSDLASVQSGVPGSGATTPGGVATAAVAGDGKIVLTVPKANLGNPAPGAVFTNTFIEANSYLLGAPAPYIIDRAPNEGYGQDFVLPGGGNVTDPGDSDSDGLNDTWETDNFGNATNANATGDPDGDGLTNGQEEALGTDPNKADTDADGCNDKEDSAPLDPAAGCGQGENTTSSTTSTSTSSSSTTTSSTSGTTTSSTSTSSGAQGNGGVDSFDEAVDRLTSDAGYLGMSAGGFLAVLVLAILALAVRWSL